MDKHKKQSPFYRPFKSHYWYNLPAVGDSEITLLHSQGENGLKHFPETPILIDLLAVPLIEHRRIATRYFDADNQILLAIFGDGTILALDIGDPKLPVIKMHSKVVLPKFISTTSTTDEHNSNANVILAHATIDPMTLQIYFSLADDRLGIMACNLVDLLRVNSKRSAKEPVANPHSQPHQLDFFVRGSGNRRFEGLTIDSNADALYCCDSKKHRAVRQWSLIDGRELPEIDTQSSGGYLMTIRSFAPYEIAITGKLSQNNPYRYLAVADCHNSRILIFRIAGEQTRLSHVLASFGSKPGQVNSPKQILFDAAGNLFVADYGNRRVQMFSRKSVQEPPATVETEESSDGAESPPVVVWAYDCGSKMVPVSFAAMLTSDAQPRPVIVLGIAETLKPSDRLTLPVFRHILPFTCSRVKKAENQTANEPEEDEEDV